MRHKVNPHTLRVGVIKDWNSKWNPIDSIKKSSSQSVALNGDKFRNLQVTKNFISYDFKVCDVEKDIKAMKKR